MFAAMRAAGTFAAAGLIASLLCPRPGTAGSATPWPSFQPTLIPAPTTSPNQAALPPDISIAPPGPAVPAGLAKFSGIWAGRLGLAGKNAEGSTMLAVESLGATGGTVVYAYANKRIANFTAHLPATFENG